MDFPELFVWEFVPDGWKLDNLVQSKVCEPAAYTRHDPTGLVTVLGFGRVIRILNLGRDRKVRPESPRRNLDRNVPLVEDSARRNLNVGQAYLLRPERHTGCSLERSPSINIGKLCNPIKHNSGL